MPKVLIVDDESLIADTLGLIFSRNGFETRVTYSAGAALECARMFTPDLLVCDISMPGRSGLDLLGDLLQEQPQCRILVLTGYYSSLGRIDQAAARRMRPMRVLIKPCDPNELLREAGEMLQDMLPDAMAIRPLITPGRLAQPLRA